MVYEAANLIKINDGKGGHTYPIKAINILKAHGKSARESLLISGYALNCTVASAGELLRLLSIIWFELICIIDDFACFKHV